MNKKIIFIGCGVLIVIGICIAAALVAGGGLLANWFTDTQALVDYNNETVSERDKVVAELEILTDALDNAETLEEVKTEISDFEAAITKAENFINDKEVPAKGDDLKSENLKYISIAKDIVKAAKDAVAAAEAGEEVQSHIDKYNDLIDDLNTQNINIAKKLNELTGVDVVDQNTLDDFEIDYNL